MSNARSVNKAIEGVVGSFAHLDSLVEAAVTELERLGFPLQLQSEGLNLASPPGSL